jgi:hypothetical protein
MFPLITVATLVAATDEVKAALATSGEKVPPLTASSPLIT